MTTGNASAGTWIWKIPQDEYFRLLHVDAICKFIASPATWDRITMSRENLVAFVESTLRPIDSQSQPTNEEESETQEEDESESEEETEQEIPIGTEYKKPDPIIPERYIGKPAPNHLASRTRHFVGNPYGIPIDTYEKCTKLGCGYVGISTLVVKYRESSDTTYVYQKIRHKGASDHWLLQDTFNGDVPWDEVFARRIKYNKKNGITLNLNNFKQDLPEVEETVDEDANQIATEVTA
jgi:hypothetical protein